MARILASNTPDSKGVMMPPVRRSFFLVVATILLSTLAACNAAAPASQTPFGTASAAPSAGATAPGGTPMTTPPGATLPPTAPPAATTPPGAGNGTLTYAATGEYQASGELVFNAANSLNLADLGGGWIAFFDSADGSITARLSTQPGEEMIEIFLGEDVIRGGVGEQNSGCTWEITRNDASGPVGSASCASPKVYPDTDKRFSLTLDWNVDL